MFSYLQVMFINMFNCYDTTAYIAVPTKSSSENHRSLCLVLHNTVIRDNLNETKLRNIVKKKKKKLRNIVTK